MTDTQQALEDSELNRLKDSVNAFFSKQQGLPSSRPGTAPAVEEAATTTAAAVAAPSKAADKAPVSAKKGKGSSEPAVPVLSTVVGQQQELTKWSNLLQTNIGLVLQDAECAEWLSSLLKDHCSTHVSQA